VKVLKISSKNAAYQKFEVLKTNRNKRHKYQEFIIEGVRNINQALENNWQIISYIYSGQTQLSGWAAALLQDNPTATNYALTSQLMAELSDKTDPSELMAIVKMQPPSPGQGRLSQAPILALVDRPSNKGNLGTLLRSCDALGVQQLIITGHSVDIYDSEVIAASTGSFFKVPHIRMSANSDIDGYIEDLRKQYPGLKVIGTDEKGTQAIHDVDLTGPLLIMMGNEKDGLNRHLLDCCDILAEIPMAQDRSASSLNISCAATVVFYEVSRQRATTPSTLRVATPPQRGIG